MTTFKLLDPKMDFIFKLIFGNEKHPKILISFLNAVIKPKNKIVSVKIKNVDLEKKHLEDKFSRLDIFATTSNDEIVNIEIQLKDEKNRTLYEMREASLHDRVSALEGAEEKGYLKAQKEIEKAQKEKKKAEKEKEKAQKEKEKVQKEKEKLLSEKKESVCSFLRMGLSKEKVAEAMKLSVAEVEKIERDNK